MPLDTTDAPRQPRFPVRPRLPGRRCPQVVAAAVRVALAAAVAAAMLAVLWYSPFAQDLRRDEAEARAVCEAAYARHRQRILDGSDDTSPAGRPGGSARAAFLEGCLAEHLEPGP